MYYEIVFWVFSSHLFWHLVSKGLKVKTSGRFFQIFVVCLEKNNWLNDLLDTGTLKKKIPKYDDVSKRKHLSDPPPPLWLRNTWMFPNDVVPTNKMTQHDK